MRQLSLRGRGQLRRWSLHAIGLLGANHESLRADVTAGLVALECATAEDADGLCWALEELQSWLTQSDVQLVLAHLVPIDELDDHHVGTFLEWCAAKHSEQLVRFLLSRLRQQHLKDKAGEYEYRAAPDHLRRRDLAGVQYAESYGTGLRAIRDTLKDETTSSQAAVDLFWRIATPQAPALSVLDDWLHAGTTEVRLLGALIRWAPEPISLRTPYFSIHATSVASAAGLADEISGAFVINAMPQQWSSKPGDVPHVFSERAKAAEDLYRQWVGVPGADLFRQVADALTQSGRNHANGAIDR